MENLSMTSYEAERSVKRSGRRPLLWLVLFITFFWTASSVGQTTTVFNIPPSDTEAFLAAIREANDSPGEYLIRLAENSEYEFDLINNPPERIFVTMAIEGQNSRFVPASEEPSFGQLFVVGSGASLKVSNLVIKGFNNGQDKSNVNIEGLISVRGGGSVVISDVQIDQITANSQYGGVFTNAGELRLDRVRISNVATIGEAIVMWNHGNGTAELENVLIIDSRGASPPGETPNAALIINSISGHIYVRFSSFIASSDLIAPEVPLRAFGRSGGGGSIFPITEVKTSILIDVGCVGDGPGFNLINDPTCTLLTETDKIGVSAEPLLIESKGGYVAIPQNGSPALDGVSDEAFECPATDAIGVKRPQDGTGNSEARCDIGAFEKKESASLFAGGENGLFYEASQDGHYVTLQEVRPNEYFMHWLTFDRNGKQAWVFALGSRDDDTITASAYFNPVGILVPGGGAEVDMAAQQDWGTITIQLFSCRIGEFSYESNLSQFGSGAFTLNRLAFIQGLGCKSD